MYLWRITMNGGRVLLGVLIALVLVGLVAGAGWYGYNVGVTQGIATGDRIAPAAGGTQVAPVVPPYGFYPPFGFYRPFGFGFGFLGCLFPLLFFFLIFALFRFAIFGPRWRRGWYGRGGWDPSKGDIPQQVKDLHQKLHEQDAGTPPPATPSA
jgi:hypothetical protein